MTRLTRLAVLFSLLTILVPSAASAAPRMLMGFQDDPSFRWRSDRMQELDRAQAANATVLRTTVYWSVVAPKRPAHAASPFDPAYKLDDLDELVRNAQQRGMEVMLTVWGTPSWANGNKGQNRMPTRLSDLQNFMHALALRYSGRYKGYPVVRLYSVWNEPNLEQFLAPQFDAKGNDVGPGLYAKLYRAAYAGIKTGNGHALVAIGETSARGRDHRINANTQQTNSPGHFAQLVAASRPRVRFDAWAQHPYPTTPQQKPTQKVKWPNVSLTSFPRFEASLDKWFGRKNTPIWITEYGHETTPGHHGVSYATQNAYLKQAVGIARKDTHVQMFIWFVLKDDANTPWQSGLLTRSGAKKPGYASFAALARTVDSRNAIVTVHGSSPAVQVSALSIGYYSPVGSRVGVTYRLTDRGRLVASGQTAAKLAYDGQLTFRVPFKPVRKHTYVLKVQASDVHGNAVARTLELIGS